MGIGIIDEAKLSTVLSPNFILKIRSRKTFNKLVKQEGKLRNSIMAKYNDAINRGSVKKVKGVIQEEIELSDEEISEIANIGQNDETQLYRELKKSFEDSLSIASRNKNEAVRSTALHALSQAGQQLSETFDKVRLLWSNIEKDRKRMDAMVLRTEFNEISKASKETRKIGRDIQLAKNAANNMAKATKPAVATKKATEFLAIIKEEAFLVRDLHVNLVNILFVIEHKNEKFMGGVINLRSKGFPPDIIKDEFTEYEAKKHKEKGELNSQSQLALLLMRMFGRFAQEAQAAANKK